MSDAVGRFTVKSRDSRLNSQIVNVVEAVDLRRTYRITTGTLRRRSREVEAVRGVSFSIREGELFGLLGPNGAGKTTTIKLLNTLLIPTAGSAHVLGYDVVRDAQRVRERVGYVFGGDRGLYERLSALDNLRYFAELYGVEPRRQRARIDELLGARRSRGPRARAGRGLQPRHAAAAPHRPRPPSRPARPLPRRADDRGRPGRRPRAARPDRVADAGRQDGAADDALHVRGRLALRPDRRDREGRDRRAGDAAAAEGAGRAERRRRDRGLRDRRSVGPPDRAAAGRARRDRRGAGAEAAADRADGSRRRADARDPRPAADGVGRPRLLARADARGRLRAARHA